MCKTRKLVHTTKYGKKASLYMYTYELTEQGNP